MDDESSVRGALVRALRVRGYEVVETDTIDDAVGVLDESAVDAAVLDVRIPKGSGLDMLRPLREHLELMKIPVLVWTGSLLSQEPRNRRSPGTALTSSGSRKASGRSSTSSINSWIETGRASARRSYSPDHASRAAADKATSILLLRPRK